MYLRQARDMEAIRYLDDRDGNSAVATAQGAFEVEGDDAVHLHGDGHRGPCHQRDVSQPSTCRAASSTLNNKPQRLTEFHRFMRRKLRFKERAQLTGAVDMAL